MNTLLLEVLQWLQQNGYRRASFDRIVGIVPSASTYEQLADMVRQNPDIFRTAILKGGMEGLAVKDDVIVYDEIQMRLNPAPASTENLMSIALEALPRPPGYGDRGYTISAPDFVETSPSAPGRRVTDTAAEAVVQSEYYLNVGDAVGQPGSLQNVTICALLLTNYFTVIGKSACIYSESYDKAIGERAAREDAMRQVKGLLAFRVADSRTFS